MKNGSLTYAQLATKLQSLGYRENRSDVRGKAARVYEHKALTKAIIFLPDGEDDQMVATPFLNKVHLILKTHGLIEEESPAPL